MQNRAGLHRSAYFNPLKALYNPGATPPYPNIAPFGLTSKFASCVRAQSLHPWHTRSRSCRPAQLHPADGNADYKVSLVDQRSLQTTKSGEVVEKTGKRHEFGLMQKIKHTSAAAGGR